MDMTTRDIRIAEMKDAITQLNSTVESLKKAFEESRAREAEKDQTIENMKAVDVEKDKRIATLEDQVAYLAKKLFNAKSEKTQDLLIYNEN